MVLVPTWRHGLSLKYPQMQACNHGVDCVVHLAWLQGLAGITTNYTASWCDVIGSDVQTDRRQPHIDLPISCKPSHCQKALIARTTWQHEGARERPIKRAAAGGRHKSREKSRFVENQSRKFPLTFRASPRQVRATTFLNSLSSVERVTSRTTQIRIVFGSECLLREIQR
jgi:hypothetical protein